MDANLSKVFHGPPAALVAHQPISLYSQTGDVEGQVHFHNDHQILFHLEEVDGKDEKGSLCIGDQPPCQLPIEPRTGQLCDGRQRGDSNEEKQNYCITINVNRNEALGLSLLV